MKKYILAVVMLLPLFSYASTTSMDESLKIAKAFCSSNPECIDILALELDSSYEDGKNAANSGTQWSVLLGRKARSLNNLCDKAPNERVCKLYRDQLILRYIVGMSSVK